MKTLWHNTWWGKVVRLPLSITAIILLAIYSLVMGIYLAGLFFNHLFLGNWKDK